MKDAKKPRILFVVQSLVKGGAERLILEICQELQRRDLADVLVVGLQNRNEYPELSKGIPFKCAAIQFELSVFRQNRINVDALRNIISDFDPDIIHTNCYFQEAPAREVINKNIKYITHLHDNMMAFRNLNYAELFNRRRLTEFYEKWRLLRQYQRCNNLFIAISKDTQQFYRNALPASLVKRMVLLPNAIAYDQFANTITRSTIAGRTIQLVNIGHFAPKKNQLFLLDVVKVLQTHNVDVMLTLVGDNSSVTEVFKERVRWLGIEDRVQLTGLVENPEEYLKAADVYVHSAYYEPFGLVLLEAMASGLPVVCLDGGGNRDIIEDGKNGFILAEQNAECFANKIIQLIEAPELYQQMSTYAREYAKRYDIRDYVDNLLKIYKSA